MKRRYPAVVLLLALCLAQVGFAQQMPPLDALKQEAVAEVDKSQRLTQQIVDEIFSFSELGFQEIETARYTYGNSGKKRVPSYKGNCGSADRVGGIVRQRKTGDRVYHGR